MIIKKYVAKNMNEALTRIRHELGREAVIISQRKVRQEGFVGLFSPKLIEVTAAVENKLEPAKKERTKDDDSLFRLKQVMEREINKQRNEEEIEPLKVESNSNGQNNDDLREEVLNIKKMLKEVVKNTNKEDEENLLDRWDIDVDIQREIMDETSDLGNKEKLKRILERDINISNKELRGKVVLVGPTGVGKTTTIAKLAGTLALIEKKKVGLITVDTYRIGAVDQLRTYAEIMQIPFKVVITIKEMEDAIDSMKDMDVVLIDTTGRSSKNKMQLSEIRAFIEKAQGDMVNLVISATTKNRDIEAILEGYDCLGYESVIITKLDETSSYGVIYNILKKANRELAYITTGQNVPDDIRKPTREEVMRLILGEEAVC